MTGAFDHGELEDGDLVEASPSCDIPKDVSEAVRTQTGIDARRFDADGRLAQVTFDAAVRRMRAARRPAH